MWDALLDDAPKWASHTSSRANHIGSRREHSSLRVHPVVPDLVKCIARAEVRDCNRDLDVTKLTSVIQRTADNRIECLLSWFL